MDMIELDSKYYDPHLVFLGTQSVDLVSDKLLYLIIQQAISKLGTKDQVVSTVPNCVR